MPDVSNMDDVIDSRDVIERIEELEQEILYALNDQLPEDTDEYDTDVFEDRGAAEDLAEGADMGAEFMELCVLLDLQDEAEGYASDWRYGETLIRDSYFEKYAQELAEDIGAVNSDARWPNNCIDWEQAARELQYYYTTVSFDGVDYWVRSC